MINKGELQKIQFYKESPYYESSNIMKVKGNFLLGIN
jgi:hypothetical protein